MTAMTVQLRYGRALPQRLRALGDVVLTGATVGSAVLAEFVALFGVRQGGLTQPDVTLLSWLLALTMLVSLVRIATPITRQYAETTGIPEARVLMWLGLILVVTFIALAVLLAVVERR